MAQLHPRCFSNIQISFCTSPLFPPHHGVALVSLQEQIRTQITVIRGGFKVSNCFRLLGKKTSHKKNECKLPAASSVMVLMAFGDQMWIHRLGSGYETPEEVSRMGRCRSGNSGIGYWALDSRGCSHTGVSALWSRHQVDSGSLFRGFPPRLRLFTLVWGLSHW